MSPIAARASAGSTHVPVSRDGERAQPLPLAERELAHAVAAREPFARRIRRPRLWNVRASTPRTPAAEPLREFGAARRG